MSAHNVPVLSDYYLRRYDEMLRSKRGWPLRESRFDRHWMHSRYPVTKGTNRGKRRYKVDIVNVRNQFNRCHTQLQVWLAEISHFYCLRETSSLKWHNVVIDRLEPAEPLAIPKY